MRPMKFALRRLALPAFPLALVLAAVSSAWASADVYAPFGNSTQRTDGGIVAGSSYNIVAFQPGWGFEFDALGFIDVGEDGLAGSYEVGLWDSAQQLVASATVTPASPLVNGFRWAPIAPVILGPGSFTVAALLPAGPVDPWLDEVDGTVLAVGLTGQGLGQYAASTTLAFPATTESSIYAVANARGASVPVPEPTSVLTLLSMAGLLGLTRRRPGGCAASGALR